MDVVAIVFNTLYTCLRYSLALLCTVILIGALKDLHLLKSARQWSEVFQKLPFLRKRRTIDEDRNKALVKYHTDHSRFNNRQHPQLGLKKAQRLLTHGRKTPAVKPRSWSLHVSKEIVILSFLLSIACGLYVQNHFDEFHFSNNVTLNNEMFTRARRWTPTSLNVFNFSNLNKNYSVFSLFQKSWNNSSLVVKAKSRVSNISQWIQNTPNITIGLGDMTRRVRASKSFLVSSATGMFVWLRKSLVSPLLEMGRALHNNILEIHVVDTLTKTLQLVREKFSRLSALIATGFLDLKHHFGDLRQNVSDFFISLKASERIHMFYNSLLEFCQRLLQKYESGLLLGQLQSLDIDNDLLLVLSVLSLCCIFVIWSLIVHYQKKKE